MSLEQEQLDALVRGFRAEYLGNPEELAAIDRLRNVPEALRMLRVSGLSPLELERAHERDRLWRGK